MSSPCPGWAPQGLARAARGGCLEQDADNNANMRTAETKRVLLARRLIHCNRYPVG